MTIAYPATKARISFGEILERVATRGDVVVIERLGKPVARINPYIVDSVRLTRLRKRLALYGSGKNAGREVRTDRDER